MIIMKIMTMKMMTAIIMKKVRKKGALKNALLFFHSIIV